MDFSFSLPDDLAINNLYPSVKELGTPSLTDPTDIQNYLNAYCLKQFKNLILQNLREQAQVKFEQDLETNTATTLAPLDAQIASLQPQTTLPISEPPQPITPIT